MKGSDLLDRMELVDLELIEEAEQAEPHTPKRRLTWCSAACIGLILLGSMLFFEGQRKNPKPELQTQKEICSESREEAAEAPRAKPEFIYNTPDQMMSADCAPTPPRGYFTEPLTSEQIAQVEPGKKYAYMKYSGKAGFAGDGTCINLALSVETTQPEVLVKAAINPWEEEILLLEAPVYSEWNGAVYVVWEYAAEDKTILDARMQLENGNTLRLTVAADQEQLPQARKDFEEILECFTFYQEGAPDLTSIIPSEIPEWTEKEMTLEEAYRDPDFGAYLPKELPEGFELNGCYRWKDQQTDMLSGVWSHGYDTLSWRIYSMGADDWNRLTDTDEPKNYDMSLYPVPLCDSVPENLRTIVNNPIFKAEELTLDVVQARVSQAADAGDPSTLRISAFGVLYGDVVVEVNAKGIPVTWLYEQLRSLIEARE